jgi:hypothetical protein
MHLRIRPEVSFQRVYSYLCVDFEASPIRLHLVAMIARLARKQRWTCPSREDEGSFQIGGLSRLPRLRREDRGVPFCRDGDMAYSINCEKIKAKKEGRSSMYVKVVEVESGD